MFKEKCCKRCRHVKFKGTMKKWPVQKQTYKTAQKHTEHQNATIIQNKVCVCLFQIFLLHLKIEFCSCDGCVNGLALFSTIDEQLQLNLGCYFCTQGMLP